MHFASDVSFMQLDDELCLCFHVSKRKVLNYLRIERPRRAGQLSECYGAGTGCGWCRTYLEKLFRDHAAAVAASSGSESTAKVSATHTADEPTAEEYARLRARYVRAGGGTPPPGATPVDEADAETDS